jgi:transcriptional regulator with XRE-family HTH domain
MTGLQLLLNLSDISQKELAEKLDKSPQLINHWVKKRKNIPRDQFANIGNIFNIPSIHRQYLGKELTPAEKIILERGYLDAHDQQDSYEPMLKGETSDILKNIEKYLLDDTVYSPYASNEEIISDRVLGILMDLITLFDEYDLRKIDSITILLSILTIYDKSWEKNVENRGQGLWSDLFIALKRNRVI